MAKRFTATDKWDDNWFFGLSNEAKLFWLYLLDKCDHAGIWQVNMVIASAYLKFTPSVDMVKDKVVVLSGDKWFIPKFICFQYGELNDNNRMHTSVINVLKKEGVFKGHISPLQGAKDMEQDKDKDKVKEQKNNKGANFSEIPTVDMVAEYCLERKNGVDAQQWYDFYSSKGWMIGKNRIVDWKAAVRTWESRNAPKKDTRRYL